MGMKRQPVRVRKRAFLTRGGQEVLNPDTTKKKTSRRHSLAGVVTVRVDVCVNPTVVLYGTSTLM